VIFCSVSRSAPWCVVCVVCVCVVSTYPAIQTIQLE
jgi:hypothetical protein